MGRALLNEGQKACLERAKNTLSALHLTLYSETCQKEFGPCLNALRKHCGSILNILIDVEANDDLATLTVLSDEVKFLMLEDMLPNLSDEMEAIVFPSAEVVFKSWDACEGVGEQLRYIVSSFESFLRELCAVLCDYFDFDSGPSCDQARFFFQGAGEPEIPERKEVLEQFDEALNTLDEISDAIANLSDTASNTL